MIARGRLQDDTKSCKPRALRDRAQRIASDRKSSDGDHHCANGPGGQAFERFERMVRDTAHSLGKKVVFEILGSDIEVDKSVLDEIGER